MPAHTGERDQRQRSVGGGGKRGGESGREGKTWGERGRRRLQGSMIMTTGTHPHTNTIIVSPLSSMLNQKMSKKYTHTTRQTVGGRDGREKSALSHSLLTRLGTGRELMTASKMVSHTRPREKARRLRDAVARQEERRERVSIRDMKRAAAPSSGTPNARPEAKKVSFPAPFPSFSSSSFNKSPCCLSHWLYD